MTYLNVQAPVRKIWPAIIAGLALFMAGALSISGINMFDARLGFGFVPLLVLAIWPRQANTLVSLALVFFAGIFTDWATGGLMGQWSLIFVLVWGLMRPELRNAPFAPLGLGLIWLAICGLALLIISMSGLFVYGIWPDIAALGRQIIIATALLPFVMLLRRGLAMRFNDNEDWS